MKLLGYALMAPLIIVILVAIGAYIYALFNFYPVQTVAVALIVMFALGFMFVKVSEED